MSKRLKLVHPGEVLREEFAVPLGLSAYKLAKSLGVSQPTIGEILNEKRSLTADMALRLSQFFGNSPEFWMNLQTHFDLEERRERLGRELVRIVRFVPSSEQAPTKRRRRLG